MLQSKARITAIGSYVPERVLTNEDLEKLVDTNDEWIIQRTGIKERRIAEEKEFSSDLAVKAALNLKERFNKSLEDIDLIIVSTFTPDYKTPSVASRLQAKLGIKQTGAFDLNAACAGFTYALHVANGLITSGVNKKILVVGSETMSKIIDYTDRTTCILFGDGAGAALVEYDEEAPSFMSTHLGSKGEAGINLYGTHLATEMDGEELIMNGHLVQNGREVYKWAVTTVPKGMRALTEKYGVGLTDVDWFVPHSANMRMVESICERTKFPVERALTSLVYYGNTSAASIPLALDIGLREGKLKKGDLVLLYGFGGGLAHSGQLVKWNLDES